MVKHPGAGLLIIGLLIVIGLLFALTGCQGVSVFRNAFNPPKTADSAYLTGFEQGYAKAQAERPTYDVCLRYITKPELEKFLKENLCDRCGNNSTGCMDRAECLANAAREHGWDCYGVMMNGDIDGHLIVAFPLKTGEVVYIEPQTDQTVTVGVDMDYTTNFQGGEEPWFIRKIAILR